MSIFKSCDVRGVVGQEWDESDAHHIGHGLAIMLHQRGESRICVGGDFRRSTPRLKQALVAGLTDGGLQVVDVGQVPTPVVAFAARHLGLKNLAIVTASHNPGKYNGIKFLVAGQPPTPGLIAELQQVMRASATHARAGSSSDSGSVTQQDVLPDYRSWVVRAARQFVAAGVPGCDAEAVARWRIAVDTMGGAYTDIAGRVLNDAGCEVVSVDPQIDPDFVRRDPNPSQDVNLDRVRATVAEQRLDAGLALDGDGDRVVFVDADARIARPEQIAVMLFERCCPHGTVVFDLKCASIVARAARASGGAAIMQPSGHGFIKSTMLTRRAELGVEVSGHHFFGILDGGDDGLFTSLVVLDLLRRGGTTLGRELKRIGWPHITPDLRLSLQTDSAPLLEQIARHCGGQVSRMDGVRAEYEDGWGLARASITEPALTLRFEGRDTAHLHQVVSRFLTGAPHLQPRVLERIS